MAQSSQSVEPPQNPGRFRAGEPTDTQKVLLNISTVAVCIAAATLLAPIDRWGIVAAKRFSGYLMNRNSAVRYATKQTAD
jgi:hypothetical protein